MVVHAPAGDVFALPPRDVLKRNLFALATGKLAPIRSVIDESKWSNQRHLYNDCIQSIANRDTFILTQANKVCHQPYQCFYVLKRKEEMVEKQVLDTNNLKPDEPVDSNSPKEIKSKTQPNAGGDNQFFGPWYTYKTTHSIIINGTTKDSIPNMFERLQMVKPWEIAPVP